MSKPQSLASTLAEILAMRAAQQPGDLAFRFLQDGTSATAVDLTYAGLADRAAAVSRELVDRGSAGRRVVLALDPGLDYVAALFGILGAGATAVPAFPPTGKRALPRFAGIHADCAPGLVIAAPRYAASHAGIDARLSGPAPQWLFVDGAFLAAGARPGAGGSGGPMVPADPSDPALLQYTSGSTGEPKGVAVTHANLVANSVALDRNMGPDPERVGCSWLPPYHDMGLIGTIVLAVHSGWPLVMLSPMHFVQRPSRWLRAITDHRVTISVAPNFALDLAAAAVTDDELALLDLRTLRQLYCGAEPVLKATLDRFRDRFTACGYAESAVVPCYGLAEATLFVSGKPAGTTHRSTWLDRAALERGLVRASTPGAPDATEVVSCGAVATGHEVLVVDPETRRPVPPGTVGEVWVSGPNVAAGYLGRPDESAATFAARPAGDEAGAGAGRPWLRTADLGFVLDGELHVTGRLTDVIVVGGRNLMPQDVELTVRAASADVRGVAAFPVDGDRGERLVVVCEVRRGARPSGAELDALRAAVVGAVTAEHGVAPAHVHVGPAGTVRTTTSGKVQRRPTRRAFLDGTLRRLEPSADPVAVPAGGGR